MAHQSPQSSKLTSPRSYPQPARRGDYPPLWQKSTSRRRQSGPFVMASGGMLALAAVLITPNFRSKPVSPQPDLCQQQVQPQSFLSRDQLSELLAISERSSKASVQNVIAQPYCIMTPSSYREGVQAQREAYPLEFDPHTWLIVLYEGDEYAGYDFSFRR